MPYIFKKQSVTEEKEIRTGATCDNCGKTLEPIFTDINGDVYGFKCALHITVTGGYGEFIDGDGQGILCKECTETLEKLADERPELRFFKTLLNDYDYSTECQT